jgi:hypothetical protein
VYFALTSCTSILTSLGCFDGMKDITSRYHFVEPTSCWVTKESVTPVFEDLHGFLVPFSGQINVQVEEGQAVADKPGERVT